MRPAADVALAVKRVQHRHHSALTAALAGLGVSLVQWDTLRHDLAQLTFQTDQSFGTLAARMADRGLIERVPGPGRAIRHRITGKGEAIRAEGEKRAAAVVRHSFGGLTAQQVEQLGELLELVLAQPLPADKPVAATA
jgi:DNA-binding MarR family transcriptional regulator